MFSFRKRSTIPSRDEALPGRPNAIPTAEQHFVNGAPDQGPLSRRLETAVFGLGCFWGAERKFWKCPACTRPRSATRAASRRTRPTKRCAAASPATPKPCSWCSIPKEISYEELLKAFWESHDPTQGMRQGNDVGTQYRSAIY